MAYRIAIEGVAEKELRDLLESASQLVSLQDEPPRTYTGLSRRIARDRERFMEVLRSEGYYAAGVEDRVDRKSTPVDITMIVDTGPVYRLESYDIAYTPSLPVPNKAPDGPAALGLEIGAPARGPGIEQARRDLVRRLGENGYPLNKISDEKIVVDHARATMRVAITVDPGPPSVFGPLSITGLSKVEESYVRLLRTWAEGAPYDRREVEAYRKTLSATELFEVVALSHADEPDASGSLPMALRLVEAKHRSIGGGVRYSTDEGAGVNAFWEHRNLWGENEKLAFSSRASQIEQSLSADFTKPNYRRSGKNLLLKTELRRQRDDAFNEKNLAAFAGLERTFANWRARGGPSLDYSVLTDNEGTRNFALVGLPVSGSRDDTDDLLDPTQGTRLRLEVTPYTGIGTQTVSFLSLETAASAYFSLDADSRFVLAARGRVGSLLGADRAAIPANKRLYSGGGGSVRGYPFRTLGPLDAENDPLGGRSVLEIGIEARIRVTDEVGIVPFVGGGSAFDNVMPDRISEMKWAAGLGARYYTPVGPVRLDIAVPLDRRRDVDSAFEIYASIGQAF